ncbi:Saccharopine dehydrogenase-domain-containing protein [Catenaria anguillulae PL171]|uniref:Saccharopine dehydrogenase-domain-containing protein n=1 Tax=Catenaria anguillulae PL171 TaxID=765915 RepID=A0A1Y2HUH4_9FUNG|nr:Saccharopine dehydrogenase-domain-containing protein [Catenaria anguillulae PL171]
MTAATRLLALSRAPSRSWLPAHSRLHSTSSKPLATIGIRRETKHKWERRTPVLPSHVSSLVKDGIRVLVQPSNIRVVGTERYRAAGAEIAEDLSAADVILGIKEVEPAALIKDKTYLYFSHTHKGQPYNMGMLKDVLDKRIRLLDYELITDDKGRRQVMFGTFAGYAGMIDALHALGLRMLGMGYGTPFLNVGMAHTYPSLNHAKSTLRDLGKVIQQDGLPREFGPVVVTFTGSGNVSLGAQEVFKNLPHEFIKPSELRKLVEGGKWDSKKIYATVVDVADHVVHKTDPDRKFDFGHYVKHPQEYSSKFATHIAPYTTLLVTGHYWDTQFPRLITTEQVKKYWPEWKEKNRMVTIADISCDIGGALEFMSHAAKIDDPWFMYNPSTHTEHKNIDGEGIQIMSVDILPAELPLESSQYFGDKLLPYLKDMAKGKFEESTLKRATIAAGGKLESKHQWLEGKLPAVGPTAAAAGAGGAKVKSGDSSPAAGGGKRQRVVVLGSGYVAGPVIDYLLRRPNVDITIASNNKAEADRLTAARPSASCRLQTAEVEVHPTDMSPGLAKVLSTADVVISLVPASLHIPVAETCISQGTPLVTASYISPAMKALHARAVDKGVTIMNEVGLDPGIDHLTAKQFIDDVHANGGHLEGFVSWCGGLPAPENSGNPLGYKFSWSPRGVLLAAMNPAVFLRNGQEVSIASQDLLTSAQPVNMYKGFSLEGLPNRDSLAYIDQYQLNRNELKTMFRGTLRYKGYSKLVHHMRTLGMLGLDAVPGVEDKAVATKLTWAEWMQRLLRAPKSDVATLHMAIKNRLDAAGILGREDQAEVIAALTWLDMFSPTAPAFPAGSIATAAAHPVPLDATCAQLQAKLVYEQGERDMVAMHHEFTIRTRAGKRAGHTATMVAYGDPVPTGYSAMAKTVGLPAAIAAEMLLEGKIVEKGVLAPMKRDVYEPMLNVLQAEGVRFVEKHVDL